MELEPPAVRGENLESEQDSEDEPKKEQDHDNTIQEVDAEVSVTVADDSYDQVLSQHSTDKDTFEGSPINPLISSDDVNNLHQTVYHHTTTTDVHSRSSEAESCSEDGKIISLEVVEADWDHKFDDVIEGEHSSEDSGHSPKAVSDTNKEQESKDISLSCKCLILDLNLDLTTHLFFEDVHLDVTEQDDAANTWKEVDHGQYLIISCFTTLLTQRFQMRLTMQRRLLLKGRDSIRIR